MDLKYIIAVDFEATFNNKTNNGPHEIIEFPAVLMNLQADSIISEFHEYVKPTRNSILSPSCKELTGIKQNSVDSAKDLQTVLQSFDSWLKRVINNYNLEMPNISSTGRVNCAFVTWGDYDFEFFLIPECLRKGYTVQPYFKQWADLRTTFNSKYSVGDISLKKALNTANVPVQGRFHLGISDARNLANLARKLYVMGGKINILSKY